MEEKQRQEHHSYVISIIDCFFQPKRWIGFAVLIGCGLGGMYGLMRPLSYTTEAYFKYRGSEKEESGDAFKTIVLGRSASNNVSEAVALLRSRKLIDILIKEQGLQIDWKKHGHSSLWTDMINNLKLVSQFYKRIILIEKEPQLLFFSDVEYAKEEPLHLTLRIDGDDTVFLVQKGEERRLGVLGQSLHLEGLQMTLHKRGLLLNSFYELTVLPLAMAANDLIRSLTVHQGKDDASALHLQLKTGNRFQAAAILNGLMEFYRLNAIKEDKALANVQMQYLKQRQDELLSEQKKLMDTHANEIAAEMTGPGFANAETEMEWLLSQYVETKERLSHLKLEKERLVHLLDVKNYQALLHLYQDGAGSPLVEQSVLLANLTQEQDLMRLSLIAEQKKDSFQEDVLHVQVKNQLIGMNLKTSQKLYLDFCKTSSDLDLEIEKVHYLSQKILHPNCELFSLGAVLEDSVSNQIIHKASEISLMLQDGMNRSEKEKERLNAELAQQRNFLKKHLIHTQDLLILQKKMIDKNRLDVQRGILQLLDKQIALTKKKIEEGIAARLRSINDEQVQLQQHMGDVNQEMAHQPKKWMREEMIKQNMSLNSVVIEEMTRLVETKNISHHLETVRSEPLMLAQPPFKPDFPVFFLFLFGGGLAGGLGYMIYNVAINGIRATAQNLSSSGYSVLGEWTDRKRERLCLRMRQRMHAFKKENWAIIGVKANEIGAAFKDFKGICSPVSPLSEEAENIAMGCDGVFVLLQEEKLHELEFYYQCSAVVSFIFTK